MSHVRHSRQNQSFNRDAIKPKKIRKANKELLQHQKKRHVELLCLTLEEKLKERR